MTGEDKVSITLTLNEWNLALTMLAKQPYEISASIIQQIARQASDQSNVVATTQFIPAQSLNGEARDG